jgi:hypothetical protein
MTLQMFEEAYDNSTVKKMRKCFHDIPVSVSDNLPLQVTVNFDK